MNKSNLIETVYKGDHFGSIPKDWVVKKFKNIITEGKLGGNYENSESNEGIPVIKMGNLDRGIIKIDKVQNLPENEKYNSDDILKDGDLLFNTRNTLELVGKVAIWRNELPFALYNSNLMRMKFDEKFVASNYFMNYAFNSHSVLSQLRGIATGTTSVAAIYGKDLDSIKFLLPPLNEQLAITKLLDTYDKAIQTINSLIEQKQNRKKWLMQMLLTGKKRLKGFEKEKWSKKRIGDYLVKHDEKSTENNQYPVLTSSRKGIFLQKDYYTRDVASEDNTGYNVVPRGYFTFRHMSDDLVFKFNINDIVDRGIVSTLYPVFTVKNINKYFLWYKLNEGNEFKIHALEQKQGGSRTYMYFTTIAELKMNLPSIEEQDAITKVLQTIDNEIALLKNKLEKVKEQKKGLMQILLTGKKRLKVN